MDVSILSWSFATHQISEVTAIQYFSGLRTSRNHHFPQLPYDGSKIALASWLCFNAMHKTMRK